MIFTAKKYKLDKVTKPVVLIIAISIPIAYYTSQAQIIVIGLMLLLTTIIFGITSYRYFLEENSKYAILNLVALLAFYTFVFCGIKLLDVRL